MLSKNTASQRKTLSSTHIFLTRRQKSGETFDRYLIELRKLASKCDLNDFMERMIMHVIVVGIKNSALREQLLAKKTLNLEHAIEICRAAESSREFSEEIEAGEATASVNAFHESRGRYQRDHEKRELKREERGEQFGSNLLKKCKFCEKKHVWGATKCPAFGKKCSKCNQLTGTPTTVSDEDEPKYDESEELTAIEHLSPSQRTRTKRKYSRKWSSRAKIHHNRRT